MISAQNRSVFLGILLWGWLGLGAVMAAPLPSQPVSSNDLWQEAIRAYLAKNYSRSIEQLNQFLAAEEDRDRKNSAKFFLAENYRLSGATDKARPIFQSLASSAPAGPLKVSSRFREAELAYNRGDYSRAAGYLSDLAHDSHADFLFPQIRLALVKTYLKLERISEAQGIFSDILAAYPRAMLDPDIKFLFGIMKEYQGQTFDALKIYEELSADPLAQLFAGSILESQGRFFPAIEAYNQVVDKAVLDSHRLTAAYFKVRAFYKSGDYLSAGKLCDAYLAKYPQSPHAPKAALLKLLVWLAQARYEEVLQGYAGLRPMLDRLEERDRALVQSVLGEAALNLNRLSEAAQDYNAALALKAGRSPERFLKLAYVQSALGNWDQAAKILADYFQSVPHPDNLAHVLAIRANLHTGRETLAFRSLKELVTSRDPLAELGLYQLAEFYLNRQDAQTLVVQWALLEKDMANREPALEYRETAAWARLLIAEAYYHQENYLAAREYYTKALGLFPRGRVETHVWAGLVWCGFQLQDFGSVLSQSDRLLKARDVPEYLRREMSLLRAHAFFNLQQYPEAIHAYQAWLASSPGNPEAPRVLFQIAWAHYLNKSYLDAVDAWKELAQKFPAAPEAEQAMAWMADTYFQGGENAQARQVYEDLNRRFPQSADRKAYMLRLAQTYYNDQKDEDAIPKFMQILQSFPDSEEAKEARSAIESASYRIADRLNSIPAFHDFILKFPASNLAEDIQYRIGEAYYQKEKYAESLREFLQFVVAYTNSPRTPNAQYYLAVCQEQLGNSLNAAQSAEAFIKNYPQHELAPEMMFRLASLEFQLERYAAAAAHFAACAEQFSLKEYQPRAWYNAAVTYEKLQIPSKALEYYDKLIQAYPKDPNTAVSLSRLALMYAQEKNSEGVESALQKLDAQADRELVMRTWLSLAAIYQEQADPDRRESVLRRLMEKGDAHAEDYSLALVELASLYEQKKDWGSAIGVYKRLQKVATQAKWRDAAQKRIKLLQRIMKAKG